MVSEKSVCVKEGEQSRGMQWVRGMEGPWTGEDFITGTVSPFAGFMQSSKVNRSTLLKDHTGCGAK